MSAAQRKIVHVAAAVITRPDGSFLLGQRAPDTFYPGYWEFPGGKVEPGETPRDALIRELDEELGLTEPAIGPLVWQRLHIIPFIDGMYDGQRDHIYLVRTAAFEPAPRLTWPELNAEYVFELRWCTPGELDDLGALVPATLPEHLSTLLRNGPPKEPVDVGV